MTLISQSFAKLLGQTSGVIQFTRDGIYFGQADVDNGLKCWLLVNIFDIYLLHIFTFVFI